MSDKYDPNTKELTLSRNRSLAIRRSSLVNRELKLIDEVKKQKLEVLIGNHDDLLIDMTSQSIKSLVKGKYDLKVRSSMCVEEILELAENNAIDIFTQVSHPLMRVCDI